MHLQLRSVSQPEADTLGCDRGATSNIYSLKIGARARVCWPWRARQVIHQTLAARVPHA